MTQIGGKLDELQTLKGTIDQNSQRSVEILTTIRNQLGNTWWVGPAADTFRNAWQSDYEPALRRLEEALNRAAQEVQQRKDGLQAVG